MTAQQAQQTSRLQSAAEPSAGKDRVQARAFVIAWAFTVIFYFLEYAVRSSPPVTGNRNAKSYRR
jgi:hypothetical protein